MKHEYTELILNNDNMKKSMDQTTSTDKFPEKISEKSVLLNDTKLKSDSSRQSHTEKHPNLLSFKNPPSEALPTIVRFNLPEFIHFRSDHLVLAPQMASNLFNERLRNSFTFSASKFNPQSTLSNTTTVHSPLKSPSKHSFRSRYSRDTNFYHEKQHAQKYQMRPTTRKFDFTSRFHEVSRFVIFSPA